jgi:hypothetical protein
MKTESKSKKDENNVPFGATGAKEFKLVNDADLDKIAGGTFTMHCEADGNNCERDSD